MNQNSSDGTGNLIVILCTNNAIIKNGSCRASATRASWRFDDDRDLYFVPLIKAIFLPSVALTSVDRAAKCARLAVLTRRACKIACEFNSLNEGSASTCF
jgi:hypothetical protein